MEDGFGGWREDRGLLGPLEEEEQGEEGGWVREKLPQQQREALRVKRESLEKTPGEPLSLSLSLSLSLGRSLTSLVSDSASVSSRTESLCSAHWRSFLASEEVLN